MNNVYEKVYDMAVHRQTNMRNRWSKCRGDICFFMVQLSKCYGLIKRVLILIKWFNDKQQQHLIMYKHNTLE